MQTRARVCVCLWRLAGCTAAVAGVDSVSRMKETSGRRYFRLGWGCCSCEFKLTTTPPPPPPPPFKSHDPRWAAARGTTLRKSTTCLRLFAESFARAWAALTCLRFASAAPPPRHTPRPGTTEPTGGPCGAKGGRTGEGCGGGELDGGRWWRFFLVCCTSKGTLNGGNSQLVKVLRCDRFAIAFNYCAPYAAYVFVPLSANRKIVPFPVCRRQRRLTTSRSRQPALIRPTPPPRLPACRPHRCRHRRHPC